MSEKTEARVMRGPLAASAAAFSAAAFAFLSAVSFFFASAAAFFFSAAVGSVAFVPVVY